MADLPTYGQARIIRKQKGRMVNGEVVLPNMSEIPHQPRMGEKEACSYYNAQLWDAWLKEGYVFGDQNEKLAWKDFWHSASHIVEKLPIRLQKVIKELFAYGYALGYEIGISQGRRNQCGRNTNGK